MSTIGIILLAIWISFLAYVVGSVLSYLLRWFCNGEPEKPVLRKMFWE